MESNQSHIVKRFTLLKKSRYKAYFWNISLFARVRKCFDVKKQKRRMCAAEGAVDFQIFTGTSLREYLSGFLSRSRGILFR